MSLCPFGSFYRLSSFKYSRPNSSHTVLLQFWLRLPVTQKRNLYKNLKVLIIDEISLVDADMLYKIDLRLREITQKDMPFGNIAIFALGDLMQIKPVKGRVIMQCPSNQQFALVYEIDSLWHKFQCILLETNHRQGEDKEYAICLIELE